MQAEALATFDLGKDPAAVLSRYGDTQFANACLIARRLTHMHRQVVKGILA
jgi:hypothetical protein